ncbi:hypothetical protein TNCV_4659101 [Trichonephila clavipes]|nr:hypothetical protein TNCV_4659101 [Trichonephila clavipes]
MVVAIVHPHDRYVINTLRAYQIANPDEKLSLSDVRRKIVLLYISENTGLTTKRRGPQGSKLMGGQVSTHVPIDPGNRFIVPTKIQKKCAYCNKKTTKVCDRCNVGVCDKCFGFKCSTGGALGAVL